MENEIMVNEEVIENTTEEIAEATSGKGWLIAAGIGVAALVGVGIYKIAKKVKANIKAKKEEEAMIEDVEYTEIETEDCSEEA